MAAECFLCRAHIAARPGAIADNIALGVCGICGVMACTGHAVRERSRPRYECVICVPTVAAVSAAVQSPQSSRFASDLAPLVESIGGEGWLVKSVEEFVDRYPDFNQWVSKIGDTRSRQKRFYVEDDTAQFYESLAEQPRDLMLLAIAIGEGTGIPPDLLPDPLRRFVVALK